MGSEQPAVIFLQKLRKPLCETNQYLRKDFLDALELILSHSDKSREVFLNQLIASKISSDDYEKIVRITQFDNQTNDSRLRDFLAQIKEITLDTQNSEVILLGQPSVQKESEKLQLSVKKTHPPIPNKPLPALPLEVQNKHKSSVTLKIPLEVPSKDEEANHNKASVLSRFSFMKVKLGLLKKLPSKDKNEDSYLLKTSSMEASPSMPQSNPLTSPKHVSEPLLRISSVNSLDPYNMKRYEGSHMRPRLDIRHTTFFREDSSSFNKSALKPYAALHQNSAVMCANNFLGALRKVAMLTEQAIKSSYQQKDQAEVIANFSKFLYLPTNMQSEFFSQLTSENFNLGDLQKVQSIFDVQIERLLGINISTQTAQAFITSLSMLCAQTFLHKLRKLRELEKNDDFDSTVVFVAEFVDFMCLKDQNKVDFITALKDAQFTSDDFLIMEKIVYSQEEKIIAHGINLEWLKDFMGWLTWLIQEHESNYTLRDGEESDNFKLA